MVAGSDKSATRPVDRRMLLKRAAAAGAVGWVAPMIVTTAAHADGGTPKCRPAGSPSVSVSTSAACTSIPGLCNTPARIQLSWAGTCPCNGATVSCAPKVRFRTLGGPFGGAAVKLEQSAGCPGGSAVALNSWIPIGGGVSVVMLSVLDTAPVFAGTYSVVLDVYASCTRYTSKVAWKCQTYTLSWSWSGGLAGQCGISGVSAVSSACPAAIDISTCP